jgi:hypothetical protein
MAAIKNPRKKFQWGIQFPGQVDLPDFAVQKVSLPEQEIEEVEHGVGNTVEKSPGMIKTGKLTLSQIEPNFIDQVSNFFFNQLHAIQNPLTNSGAVDGYDYTILVTEYSANGQTPLNTWTCLKCWISKINGKDLDRVSSDNMINELEFSVFAVTRV